VAIVLHRGRAETVALAAKAVAFLEESGHEVRIPTDDAEVGGLQGWATPDEDLCRDLDLAVSLGGDGTMLRAVDLVAAAGVPVLGVNVGHLGYLTEVEPEGLIEALERFFAGDYRLQERMTLSVTTDPAADRAPIRVSALNEAWVEKRLPGRTTHLAVTIAGRPFTTYAADGLIVSTPTGSTAYNLSVRGPIVSPTLRALVMTPVSPHQLFDLSLVLAPDEAVGIQITDGQAATLLVDGREIAILEPGDCVRCSAGAHTARLVTFGERDFHQILKSKFGLTDR
jgi:NAD+ kinase